MNAVAKPHALGEAPASLPARRERDVRLDLFRGLALLIILVTHIPNNSWNAWIPARWGFSSAIEIFVFGSGFASALAFGRLYLERGFFTGLGRTGYRIWQLYWSQIGLMITIFALCIVVSGWTGFDYVAAYGYRQFVQAPVETLMHAVTVTYHPTFLDILPMYMVALAMIPIFLLLGRIRPWVAVAASVGLWAFTQVVPLPLPNHVGIQEPTLLDDPVAWLTGTVAFRVRDWYLNPFAWQLVFFAGFAISLGWLRLPRPRLGGRLFWLALCFVVISIPLTFWPFHGDNLLGTAFAQDTGGRLIFYRQAIADALGLEISDARPVTYLAPIRVIHFLALAYVALGLVEPVRHRLETRWTRPIILIGRQSLAVFLSGLVLAVAIRMVLDQALPERIDREIPFVSPWIREPILALGNLSGFALMYLVARIANYFRNPPWARDTAAHTPPPATMAGAAKATALPVAA